MECVVVTTRNAWAEQQCEFMCTNVGPTELVVKVYIQPQNDPREKIDSSFFCGIKLLN